MFYDISEDLENFVCNFCYVSFNTKTDRDNHIETHLIHQICDKCNKSMILIGNKLYEQHNTTNCRAASGFCDDGVCELTSYVRFLEPEVENATHTVESVLSEHKRSIEKRGNSVPQKNVKGELVNENNLLSFSKIETKTEKSIDYLAVVNKIKSNAVTKVRPHVEQKSKIKVAQKSKRSASSLKNTDQAKIEAYQNNTDKTVSLTKKKYKSEIRPKLISCGFCDKTYAVFRSLITHRKKLHNIFPVYQCHVCSIVCKTSCYLKNHIDTHYSKKYICNYCGRGFNLLFNLREHIYDHTGERPYVCEVCGKTFKRSTLKRNHMRQHTGEKPYKCGIDLCERAFAYSTDLRRHKRGAHGILTKPFECLICHKIFYENKFLRKHMETHTGREK